MRTAKRLFAAAEFKWLTAFLAPGTILLLSWFIHKQGWLRVEALRIPTFGSELLVVLGLMYAFKWKLADLGLRRRGLLPGLLAAGLLFLFFALPQWVAAYPFRWQPLGWVTAYWATYYLLVGTTEELWMRGLLYTALERRWNRKAAILGTSLAFGLAHVPYHGIGALFDGMVSGISYALIRARTGNIIGLVLAHWLLHFMDRVYVPYKGKPRIGIGLLLAGVIILPLFWLLLWRVSALANRDKTTK